MSTYTQKELSKKVGLSRQSIANYGKVWSQKKVLKNDYYVVYTYPPLLIEGIDYIWIKSNIIYYESAVTKLLTKKRKK